MRVFLISPFPVVNYIFSLCGGKSWWQGLFYWSIFTEHWAILVNLLVWEPLLSGAFEIDRCIFSVSYGLRALLVCFSGWWNFSISFGSDKSWNRVASLASIYHRVILLIADLLLSLSLFTSCTFLACYFDLRFMIITDAREKVWPLSFLTLWCLYSLLYLSPWLLRRIFLHLTFFKLFH